MKIKLTDIERGNRFREDYGDLSEFIRSIQKHGQITPIAVSNNPAGSPPYLLACGGRRLRAFEEMAKTDPTYERIEARHFDRILTDLEYRSIEAAENIDRKDFTYAEKIKILAKVHELQTQIYGQKIAKDANAPGWSQTDTAELFGLSKASVTQDLKLAKVMMMAPDLGLDKLKNKTEAMKVLNRLGKNLNATLMRREYEKLNLDENETIKRLTNSFILGDFFTRIKEVPSETVDFCEVDPPYAIELEGIKKNYGYDGYNEINVEEYESFLERTLAECYRIMKNNSWLILWYASHPWAETVYQKLTAAGFKAHRIVGMWTKPNGQTLNPKLRLANAYEPFYYAAKGSPEITKQGRSNLFDFAPVPPAEKVHPTERPLTLIKEIIETFTKENDNICVPFLGSGKTLIASHLTHRNCFGFDKTKNFKDHFVVMLNEMMISKKL